MNSYYINVQCICAFVFILLLCLLIYLSFDYECYEFNYSMNSYYKILFIIFYAFVLLILCSWIYFYFIVNFNSYAIDFIFVFILVLQCVLNSIIVWIQFKNVMNSIIWWIHIILFIVLSFNSPACNMHSICRMYVHNWNVCCVILLFNLFWSVSHLFYTLYYLWHNQFMCINKYEKFNIYNVSKYEKCWILTMYQWIWKIVQYY